MTSKEKTKDELFVSAYRERDHELRYARGIVSYVLMLILFPSGALVDYFVYPHLWVDFLWMRLAFEGVILLLFLIIFTALGKRLAGVITFLGMTLLVFQISCLIFLADGVLSNYYAVLNLAILAAGVLLPWQFIEMVFFCALTITSYALACFFHRDFSSTMDWTLLLTQSYFILLSSVVASVACFLASKNRWRMFFLNHELDARNQKLQEMDREKSQFFTNTTHELRTPLTLILTPLEEILIKYKEALSDEALSLLKLMHGNAVRLLKMVNNLLEISRLQEAKKYRAEPVEIVSFLVGLVDGLRFSAEKNGLEVIVEMPDEKLWVKLDRDAFERIIYNVAGNAIKFTSEKKEGQIIFSVLQEGEECLICVKDTGVGVAKEDIPYVFGRFYRGRKPTAYGSGLGLMLVKELLEKMDGRIKFDSVENEGTTVSMWFPLVVLDEECMTQEDMLSEESITIPREMSFSEASSGDAISSEETTILEETETSAKEKEEQDARRAVMLEELEEKPEVIRELQSGQHIGRDGKQEIKVLIVDDEPDMLAYLADTLGAHYSVTCAKNGKDALTLVTEDEYAVILLDLMMPDISGLTVCRTLRQEYPEIKSRILVLTAMTDIDPKLLMLESGADDFLGKPFSYSEVLARVHTLASNYLLERDLRKKNSSLKKTAENLKENQKLLVREEKLRSIGTMASGLIHEINNPINYLMMALTALRECLQEDKDDEAAIHIRSIDEGLSQIARITKDLHEFSQSGSRAKAELFSPSVAIGIALRLTEHLRQETVIKQKHHSTDQVIFPKQRITQVLVNLLLNAYTAIERHQKMEKLEGRITIESFVEKDCFVISIKDNGIGMTEDAMQEAFNPFYTEKPDGVGLGLSICDTIVSSYGGKIKLNSTLYQGCTVTIELPFLPEDALLPHDPPEISETNALKDILRVH